MKAVVFNGPWDVSVEQVSDPRIEEPKDAIIKITTANICGSDLHPYEGRAPLDAGMVLGHENMGVVAETGPGCDRISVGDRVSVPFNISCGTCRNCTAGWTCACLRANPSGRPTAGYGYPQMGPYWGGQAEYLRVPWADFNALVLPEDARDKQDDYVMLSDIFPTGWHAVKMSGLLPGETIVIYGGGPVGNMAALSAITMGAAKVMVVDRHPDRLRLAEQIGAIPINDSKGSPVEQVMEQTNGLGADRGAECVGYQAHDPQGHENNSLTLNDLVQSVRFTGGIGTVGVYVPEDPGGPDDLAKHGKARFDFGEFWFKGQAMGTGQCPVKRYNRYLRSLIHEGKVTPSWIVSHDLPLDQAPEAYKHFDARDEGWTKVVLHPNQTG